MRGAQDGDEGAGDADDEGQHDPEAEVAQGPHPGGEHQERPRKLARKQHDAGAHPDLQDWSLGFRI